MRSTRRTTSLLAATALATSLLGVAAVTQGGSSAHAAPQAAPGAPFRTPLVEGATTMDVKGTKVHLPWQFNVASCSQGPSGTVTIGGQARNIMVTAGHCVQEYSGEDALADDIYVNTRSGGFQRLGTLDQEGNLEVTLNTVSVRQVLHETFNDQDWATIRLANDATMTRVSDSRDSTGARTGRPVVLTGVRDYRKLGPYQVSTDNFGQPICKDGARTGRSCGTQIARTNHGIWSWGLNSKQGDSGGINFDPRTRQAVSVTSMGIGPLARSHPIDTALEQAYGIPSGQVNARFKLAESTAPHADFKSDKDEDLDLVNHLRSQGADAEPTPDYAVEYRHAVGQARAASAQISGQVGAQVAGSAQAAGAALGRGDVAGAQRAAQDAAATVDQAGSRATWHANNVARAGLFYGIVEAAGALG